MKKAVLIVVVIVLMLTAGCLARWLLQGASRSGPREHVEILSFERVTLEVIGMRYHHIYEIVSQPPEAVLSRYCVVYENGEDVKKLEKTVVCSEEEVLQLLRSCGVGRWDGFFGKHPKYVSDGEMFEFCAVINNGLEIRAEGSENFPNHFHEFRSTLDQMLSSQ